MSNILFHNKFHQATHHTVSASGFPDSAIDPIASQTKPFPGIFYNNLYVVSSYATEAVFTFNAEDLVTFAAEPVVVFLTVPGGYRSEGLSNSMEWYGLYNTLHTLSAKFGNYYTVYATVTALSATWQLGKSFSDSLLANLLSFNNTFNTTQQTSAIWEDYQNKHLTNLAQQDTKSKNFDATQLTPTSAVFWNLSANQFSIMTLSQSAIFLNINQDNKKRGGRYTLVLKQPGENIKNALFNSDYVFANSPTITGINLEKFGVTVVKFTSDGRKMYGNTEFYSLSGLLPYTYFAGVGIVLTPDPAEAVETDAFLLAGNSGLTITGAIPYFSALDGSLNITYL